MASITIRNLDAPTKARLRVRAAHRQRSMEEEARIILRAALAEDEPTPSDLGAVIGARFRPFGGVDLKLPARDLMREPPVVFDAAPQSKRRPAARAARK